MIYGLINICQAAPDHAYTRSYVRLPDLVRSVWSGITRPFSLISRSMLECMDDEIRHDFNVCVHFQMPA